VHPLFAYAAPPEAGPLPTEAHHASPAEFLCVGVGKVASAHAVTLRLVTTPRPDLVVLFGVCGAHADTAPSLDVGDVCVIGADGFGDEGVQTEDAFLSTTELGLTGDLSFAMDPSYTAAAAKLLDVPIVAGSTISTCSGNDRDAAARAARTGAAIETMEGAAVAHVCRALSIPLVQIRCVSNRTGDRDAAGWDLEGALAPLQAAVRRLVEASARGIWPA
jgi:futalosine hydrolase